VTTGKVLVLSRVRPALHWTLFAVIAVAIVITLFRIEERASRPPPGFGVIVVGAGERALPGQVRRQGGRGAGLAGAASIRGRAGVPAGVDLLRRGHPGGRDRSGVGVHATAQLRGRSVAGPSNWQKH
jgi:hypothetical protein